MTTELAGLWLEIDQTVLAAGAVQRRVLPKSKHDCFIGAHRPTGDRFLDLRLIDQSQPPTTPVPGTQALKVATRDHGESFEIQLRLVSESFLALFDDLIIDLLEVVSADLGAGTASAVLARLRAWMSFWSRGADVMGKDRAAGLYGELVVLEELVAALGDSVAVTAWTGPDLQSQDFQLPQGAIEVKTSRGSGTPRVTISSEKQLMTKPSGKLWLSVIGLDQRAQGPGETIDDIVQRLRLMITGATTDAEFKVKLIDAGWVGEAPDVRTEKYTTTYRADFRVSPEFPRLVPGSLPLGVSKVSYELDTAVLAPHLIVAPDVKELMSP